MVRGMAQTAGNEEGDVVNSSSSVDMKKEGMYHEGPEISSWHCEGAALVIPLGICQEQCILLWAFQARTIPGSGARMQASPRENACGISYIIKRNSPARQSIQ